MVVVGVVLGGGVPLGGGVIGEVVAAAVTVMPSKSRNKNFKLDFLRERSEWATESNGAMHKVGKKLKVLNIASYSVLEV